MQKAIENPTKIHFTMGVPEREYELILWGATGYTGKLTAEYISRNLPLDLKWAVAGRDREKLTELVQNLTHLDPSRAAPDILTASLNDEELDSLAKKARLLISTVGPFQAYGTLTFAACARNGTHYLDSTGETFWVADMIQQNDGIARENGSIMIPCCGFDCVPSEISVWVAADHLRRELGALTGRVDTCIHSLQGGVSGGTLASLMGAFDLYSFRQLYRIHAPFALSPKKPKPTVPPTPSSLWTKVFGLLRIKELGWMGYQPQGPVDRAIVHRTWGLLESTANAYGHSFDFHAWFKVWGPVLGVFWHMGLLTLASLFLLRPVRWLVSKVGHKPGNGNDLEKIKNNWLEYRTVAEADTSSQPRPKSLVRLRYDSDPYIFTALAIGEAARVILRDQGTPAHTLRGVLTPAILGNQYVSRLRDAGVTIQSQTANPEKRKREQLWEGF